MRWVWAVVALVCWGTGAVAQEWCRPAAGSYWSVTGVALNDVLNLRTGPGPGNPVVTRIPPRATGLKFDGGIETATVGCRNACAAVLLGAKAARPMVDYECIVKSGLWYRMRAPDGSRGWAVAKYLKMGGSAPAPLPPVQPPVQEGRFNFLCPGLGNLLLVTRAATNDAVLYAPGGASFVLVRERGAAQELAYRGRDNNPEMYVRGSPREVIYADTRGRATRCGGIR